MISRLIDERTIGMPYVLEASEDLRVWRPIKTNFPFHGSISLVRSGTNAQAYLRLVAK